MIIDYYTADAYKFLVCYTPDIYYICVYTTEGQYTTTGHSTIQAFDTFAEAQAIFGDNITDPTIEIL